MPFPRPSLPVIQQTAINLLTQAQLGNTGTVPAPNSVLMVLTQMIAQMIYSNYGYLDYISLQSVPFTATGEYIDSWANLKGITRTLPTASTALVTFNGVSNTVINQGTTISTNNGFLFTTSNSFTIGQTANVSINATTTGSAGNFPFPTNLSLQLPQIGVSNVVLVSESGITGGTDLETDASLQNRMLIAYASQPTGGSSQDFVNFALDCPGVTRAWCEPTPSALTNIVVVFVMFDVTEADNGGFPQGSNGGAALDSRIAPATGDQLTVANFIFPLRPVTSIPFIAAPVGVPVNFTINPLTSNTSAIQSLIETAIEQMLLAKQTPLGMTLFLSDLTSAIATVPGVTEFSISDFTDTNYPVGQMPVLGQITFS
jgi:uncharacterized phage protein gp47/JayE